MGLISKGFWKTYKKTINSASSDFNQTEVTWLKSMGGLDRDGEDNQTERFSKIPLLCLANYNYNRVWPVTGYTETGEIDKETEVIIFNIDYLCKLGYMKKGGTFNFDPSTDKIVHKGITWKCSGMTNLSQAGDEDLLLQLILQRENPETTKS